MVSLDGHRISIRKIELKESYEPEEDRGSGKDPDRSQQILSGEQTAK